MAGTREPRSDVATQFLVEGPPVVPHDDLLVKLKVVGPRGRYDPRLRAGADGGDQEDSEHQGGSVSNSLFR